MGNGVFKFMGIFQKRGRAQGAGHSKIIARLKPTPCNLSPVKSRVWPWVDNVSRHWPPKPIRTPYLSEFCMRSPFWLAPLFATTCFLAACGGGGSPAGDAPGNPPGTVSTTCALNLSIYADGSANGSGYAIQQGGASTPAVSRLLDGCAITSLESARLSMCIRHDDLSELTAQLVLPVMGPVQTSLTPNITPPSEDKQFCDFNQGTVYATDIPINALASLPSLNVRWNVAVTDTVQNNKLGFFISWSLLLSGKK